MQDQKEQHETEEVTETLNFDRPDFIFLPKGNHSYRQSGPYLICRSCELQHGVYIGIEKIMVGVDEKGEPILKKRKDLGM